MAQEFTIHMKLDRVTKGAIRFQEVDGKGDKIDIGDGAKLGTLYIRKTAIGHAEEVEVNIRVVK